MKLAPLSEMWPQYPDGTRAQVAALVGGACGENITKYNWDTCCVRLSRSLNYSARPIEGFSSLITKHMDPKGSKLRASKGADEKWYIYSTYDLRVYLVARFGQPQKFKGDLTELKTELADVKGIIAFAYRHVDLWDGTDVRYNQEFADGTKKVKEVLIWETPGDPAPSSVPSP